ncbi:hypothetical protein NKH56_35865 [Mesorhizobium sp. M1076]
MDLGDRAGALRLFVKAEKAAVTGYWSSFMGGEKLELQRLRIELEGDAGREKGYDVLLGELTTGQTSGPALFLNLDTVLEQVTVEMPHEALWIETEQHLRQYREYRIAGPVEPIAGIAS